MAIKIRSARIARKPVSSEKTLCARVYTVGSMHTDKLFYRLFRERPATVFELAGLSVPADADYRLHAEEIKETAFRLDGVLVPGESRPDLPLVFTESQFYLDSTFYARWLAAIFRYLHRHEVQQRWLAVVVYPERSTDRGGLVPYQALVDGGVLHRVYLEELSDAPVQSLGVRIAKLTIMEDMQAVAEAQRLIEEEAPYSPVAHHQLIDLVETVLVYKLPNLSREEIQKMLHLPETDLKKTRFYQDVFAEGRQEGEATLVLRLLRRKLGPLTNAQEIAVHSLRAESLETLSEALLDFESGTDLNSWLESI